MKTQIELFNDPVLNETDCINGSTNLNMTNPYQLYINIYMVNNANLKTNIAEKLYIANHCLNLQI